MSEKEDLMKEFELLQEWSKYYFNGICYKKRSNVVMVLEIKSEELIPIPKNDLCTRVTS